MLKKSYFFFSKKKYQTNYFFIFALNVFLRIPATFQELPPNTFCDEDLIINYAYKNFNENKIYYYGIGQINYYLAALPAYLIEFLFNEKSIKETIYNFSKITRPCIS